MEGAAGDAEPEPERPVTVVPRSAALAGVADDRTWSRLFVKRERRPAAANSTIGMSHVPPASSTESISYATEKACLVTMG
jgi:hypothetical protein